MLTRALELLPTPELSLQRHFVVSADRKGLQRMGVLLGLSPTDHLGEAGGAALTISLLLCLCSGCNPHRGREPQPPEVHLPPQILAGL